MNYIAKDVKLSDCKNYRYFLCRQWNNNNKIMTYIMLNPSTADGVKDDQTIRKCVKLAMREDCGSIYVTNLFALRSSKPDVLYTHNDPIGPDNNYWIDNIAKKSEIIVAAWGNHGSYLNRNVEVIESLKLSGITNLYCLGLNKTGAPKHPLAHDINMNTKFIKYDFYT